MRSNTYLYNNPKEFTFLKCKKITKFFNYFEDVKHLNHYWNYEIHHPT